MSYNNPASKGSAPSEGRHVGILLMGYGSPESVDDVGAYLENIKAKHAAGGKPTSPTAQEVETLKNRYRAIGGKSPFNEITREQAAALERALAKRGLNMGVYVGMKHSEPGIAKAVDAMHRDGVTEIIGLPLAPYYSSISTGGYKRELMEAAKAYGPGLKVQFVDEWHADELFIRSWTEGAGREIARTGAKAEDVFVLFTAHSLPSAILRQNDPYPNQFAETSRAVAESLCVKNWAIAYQSASGKDWLGPDVLTKVEELCRAGHNTIVIVPIGFITENLETLYDIDIECIPAFRKRGVNISRVAAPNASPLLIDALASIVVGRSGTPA